MKILQLILSGSKRLALGGKQYFEINPTTDFQLIIGTNGSGKSSMLYELSMLPAIANDYFKDGYKFVKCEHNGFIYEARSEFKQGNKHTLVRYKIGSDDKEILNDGGTLTIQKELIKQHFGLTFEIHDILTEQVGSRFTEMSPKVRQYWFTQFCPVDLSFASRLYQDIKGRVRDGVGAVKHLSNRLAVETNKLMEMEDVAELEQQAKQLREELNLLMQERESGLPGMWGEEQVLRDNLQQLETLSRQVLEMKIAPPEGIELPEQHDLRHVDEALSDLRQEAGIAESMLSHYSTEYSELDHIVKTLDNSGAGGIEELEERISELSNEESDVLGTIEHFLVEDNPEEARDDTKNAIDNLIQTLRSIPVLKHKELTPASYDALKVKIDNARFDIDKHNNRLRQFQERLEHVLQAKETNCPKCGYIWKPGVSEDDAHRLEASIEELSATIKILTAQYKDIENEMEEADAFVNNVRRYRHIAAAYPRLSQLWDYIATKELLSYPDEAILAAYRWSNDIHTSCTINAIRKEKKSLTEALEHAKRLEHNDSSMFGERVKTLQDTIEQTSDKIRTLRFKVQQLKDYHETLKRLGNLKGEITRLVEKINNSTLLVQRIVRNDMLGELIGKHQTSLALAQTYLNEKSTLEGIVKDIQQSIQKVMRDKEIDTLLMEELSPTDGLIAEQLMSTIRPVTEQLNDIISLFWTYDLVIQDCGTENGELDYKFPLMIETPDKIKDDISKGSTGMTDIINFAFKVLAYRYLGLEQFPLYLDEFGSSFDPEHLNRAMSYVQSCLDTHMHSQIFMINHDENYYGSFANAQITVLHNSNVNIAYEHNKHVKIL